MLLEAGFQQSCSTRVTANDRTAGLIGLQYRNKAEEGRLEGRTGGDEGGEGA